LKHWNCARFDRITIAPVVRNAPDGERELTLLRWGMATPPMFLIGPIDPGVTNIRNPNSPHWRRWLKPDNRCVVPATSFCEPSTEPDPATGKKVWTWFVLDDDRPLFFFAVDAEHTLFGFLTTEPNAVVKPVHSKAMPAILTTREEVETWMTAPAPIALQLQRPLPPEMLRIVARGAKVDTGSALGASRQ
jgi:putative SOS response-associated peptidase YedK